MKKLIAVVAIAALCGTTAFAQPTLDLSIVATPGAGAGEYTIDIVGLMGGDSHDGLALWACNLEATAGDLDVDIDAMAAVGDMTAFDKNDGLTNPAGYGGTPSAGALIQIGGGQNTIGNTNPPAYPIGAVITGVGNTAVVLATGTYTLPAEQTEDVVLTISGAFANALNPSGGPDVYAVTAIETITYSVPSVTIPVGTSGVDIAAVASVGAHTGIGDMAIDILANSVEPRVMEKDGDVLRIEVTCTDTVAAEVYDLGAVVSGAIATADGTDVVVITYPTTLPADDACYTFDLSGMAGINDDNEFCICYIEADIDRNGTVTGGDKNKVIDPNNWLAAADVAADAPVVDVNRTGLVDGGDKNKVIDPANWNPSGAALSCP